LPLSFSSQQAAVLTAKLEAMTERATKAEVRADTAGKNANQSSAEAAELRGRLNAAVDTKSWRRQKQP